LNQEKIGEFLKSLRKSKGLTQEQLAEQFYVSSRTISRWETGSNMPDLDTLMNLSDFYEVEIREILDGERKSENMENEEKETLKKVAEYAVKEKRLKEKIRVKRLLIMLMITMVSLMLFSSGEKGLLYGIVPDIICEIILWIVIVTGFIMLIEAMLFSAGVIDKIRNLKKKT